jgi:hydrogenase nickel incorporation protein HypA/HybF
MCQGIIEVVERRAAGRPVAKVRVRVGVLHRVVPAAFEQAFLLVADGSVAEGAELDLVVTPAEATCRSCGRHVTSEDDLPICPHCEGTDLAYEQGNELVVESLEYAADESAPSAPA